MSSVFTKVINGELPGSFVYQDDLCVVFMDLFPFGEGHLLVVPREEKAKLTELPSETVAHMFVVAQKVMKAIDASSVSSDGYSLFMSQAEFAGQEVPHCHLHILPRTPGDGIDISLGVEPSMCEREKLDQLAKLIGDEIES